MIRASVLLLLVACNPPIPEDGKPGDDSGATDTDTAVTPVESVTYTWVVDSLVVASANDGFDLDADGDKDNALAVLDAGIDPLLRGAFADAEQVLLAQLAGVSSLEDDAVVRAAFFPATDGDADHSGADNYSGSEGFDGGSYVDGDGDAVSFSEVPLASNTYTAVFPPLSLQFGGLELNASTEVHLGGRNFTSAEHEGLLGFGIPVASFAKVAEALGLEPADVERLRGLADLDTDADGVNESISAAFDLHAVGCTVE